MFKDGIKKLTDIGKRIKIFQRGLPREKVAKQLSPKANFTGFTLVEILIVFAVIALLSSIVLVNVNLARIRSRDAKRLEELKTIQIALEHYYNDNSQYPPINCATSVSVDATSKCPNGLANWQSLGTILAPYLTSSGMPADPLSDNIHYYFYASNAGDNYQIYGLASYVEQTGPTSLAAKDGGNYAAAYEVGEQPKYCYNRDICPAPSGSGGCTYDGVEKEWFKIGFPYKTADLSSDASSCVCVGTLGTGRTDYDGSANPALQCN